MKREIEVVGPAEFVYRGCTVRMEGDGGDGIDYYIKRPGETDLERVYTRSNESQVYLEWVFNLIDKQEDET